MILTRTRLREMGERLYGAQWPDVLAAKLNRSRKTIARWRSGEYPIPCTLRSQLIAMLEEQEAVIATAKDSILSD